jgi:acetyltransferase-like isoleucine patch superfamily enzyme
MKSFIANQLLRILAWCIENRSGDGGRIFQLLRETYLTAPCIYGPTERLIVGERVSRANTLFNTRSGTITIKTGVMFGHNCMVLTGYHDYSKRGETRERIALENAGRDILIEEGAWIASGVIIVGPCRVGKNAVVGSGAVVVSDIPDEVFAAGNPARIIRKLEISNG